MADAPETPKPPVNKWLFALILLALVLFMYISVSYKIYTKGP